MFVNVFFFIQKLDIWQTFKILNKHPKWLLKSQLIGKFSKELFLKNIAN